MKVNIVRYLEMHAALQIPDTARSGRNEAALPEQCPAAGAAECTPILLHQAPGKNSQDGNDELDHFFQPTD